VTIADIEYIDLINGKLTFDIGVSEAKNRVKSIDAQCGCSGSELNVDEIAIRKEILNLSMKWLSKSGWFNFCPIQWKRFIIKEQHHVIA